ncbi:MAG: 1-deoxy-D-xylulose-5-phosphate reductoisomerase, partial [Clostridia bacterium]|nr:1-deoxy-D-xylulose-5-phosphate reductoisomerase [Clostridia bacterium]
KAAESGCEIIPVDSEHSAIFQCLQGNEKKAVKRLLLTASGGPFFGYTKEQLASVTKAQTLAHPTWQMGQKITVDSATMMNKGFEIIEAVRLFDIPADRIEVLVHRQSIIHSAVEYIDNVVMAQMGVPDMRTCVAYALTYPARGQAVSAPLDLASVGTLTFARPDEESFPLLKMAKDAVACGGAIPGVLNAANEVAVAAFLAEKISFCEIASLVIDTCRHFEKEGKAAKTLEEILQISAKGRAYAEALLN